MQRLSSFSEANNPVNPVRCYLFSQKSLSQMLERVLNTHLLLDVNNKQISSLSVESKKNYIKFSNNSTTMYKKNFISLVLTYTGDVQRRRKEDLKSHYKERCKIASPFKFCVSKCFFPIENFFPDPLDINTTG